jgi:hypothetical protein
MLAATIDFQFEFEPVAFVEAGHASTLDGGDVHERIGLSVIALDEAEALHRIEELDRTGRLLAGQLALWSGTEAAACARTTTARCATGGSITLTRRTAIGHFHRLAIDLEVGRRDPATAIDQREAQGLTFGQTGQAGLLDCADVHEHILTAIIANDEAETLLAVEELDDAGAFANDLGGHATACAAATRAAEAATTTAAAAETTAAATAAEAITAAAAETVTTAAAAAKAITTAKAAAAAAVEIIAAETVALVAATPTAVTAASFIETHALFVFPVRQTCLSKPNARRKARVSGHQTNRATESV